MSDSPHLLVIGDSLAFHGPGQAEPPTHPGLYPNVCATDLGGNVRIDLVARLGYTARDGWWALTKDATVWGVFLPRATGVILALGQMDQLPAAVPTWLRESIPFIRPGSLRRKVRSAYLRAAPRIITATDGRMSQLSTTATSHYLTRIATGIRYIRPDLPIVRLLPAPYDSRLYPSARPHGPALAAGRRWCLDNDVPGVELDPLVLPGPNNPDGLHWGWETHGRIGHATAKALANAGWAGLS